MLTVAILVLLSFIALLAIPVTLTFKVSWQRVFQHDIELLWAFGLVRVRVPSLQSKPPSPERESLKPEIDSPERSFGKKQNIFAVVRQQRLRGRIMRFIRDVWRAVHKKDLSLLIRVGLGDPADTGQLWAVFGPVAGILANVEEASIRLEPEFLDTTHEIDSSGRMRLIPLQILYLTAALLLSPPIWQGIKQLRTAGQ